MIQSKAFDVLKELKRKEFQQFEKYLNSSLKEVNNNNIFKKNKKIIFFF